MKEILIFFFFRQMVSKTKLSVHFTFFKSECLTFFPYVFVYLFDYFHMF